MGLERQSENELCSEQQARLNAMQQRESDLLKEAWQAMRLCLYEASFDADISLVPRPDLAEYTLKTDPVDQTDILEGIWRDKRGAKQGEVQIRSDGRLYAEVDVIRSHPTDVRWFVESVTVWGCCGSLKTELRLLPSVID